jgi:oligopeptide/dipeptide ABC transporter ATP-binding protein
VELQKEHQMSLLLITHDLGVIAQTAHRVAVMYAGRLVEVAHVEELFDNPRHPYTRGLLHSLPRPGSHSRKQPMPSIPGTVPSPGAIPQGCAFYDRCGFRDDKQCLNERPNLEEGATEHWVSCHFAAEIPPFKVNSSDEVTP